MIKSVGRDVIKPSGGRAVWLVRDAVFCEKGGLSIDILDRLIFNKEIDCLIFKRVCMKGVQKYVVIDWRAKRLLEYCGKGIKEEWYKQPWRHARKKVIAAEGVKEDELEVWGRRVMNRRHIREQGKVYYSTEEVAKLTGQSEKKMKWLVNLGVLTGYRWTRLPSDVWTRKKRLYIVDDDFLDIFLIHMGVVCTGMTLERAKKSMTELGSRVAIKGYDFSHHLGKYMRRKEEVLKTI